MQVSNGGRHDENHRNKRYSCTQKRTSEVRTPSKYKQYKTESGPVVDLRHDDRDSSPTKTNSVGNTPPASNEVLTENSEPYDDMAIAEALTRLAG